MIVLELLAIGGLSYLGNKMAQRKKNQPEVQSKKEKTSETIPPSPVPVIPVTPARAKRDLRLSGASLGLALSGTLLGAPFLSLMSLPSLVCVAMPTFRNALSALRKWQIDDDSHRATRVILCLGTGLWVVAALDLTLQMAIRRKVVQTEIDFKNRLGVLLGHPTESVWVLQDGVELEMPVYKIEPGTRIMLTVGDIAPFPGTVVSGTGRIRPVLMADSEGEDIHAGASLSAGCVVTDGSIEVELMHPPAILPDLRQELEHAAETRTTLTQLGSESGARAAPWMMGAFAAGLPFMGFSRSAVFLTTRMGSQMDQLGPHAARQAIAAGLEHGILIREVSALERAGAINMIVFDVSVLKHPAARPLISSLLIDLRQRHGPQMARIGVVRPFGLYVMADDEETGQEWLDTYGFDDYFKEPLEWGRTQLIRNFQQGGRPVCYVSLPGKSDQTLKQAHLSVVWCPDGLPQPTPASILLAGPHLPDLSTLFDLARAFASRQHSNFLAPMGVDILNVAANIFLSSGLMYSVVLSNLVSLLDVSGPGFVKREWNPPPKNDPESVDPNRSVSS